MYRFIEKKNGKVWTQKADSFAEAKAAILKVLGYKPDTWVIKTRVDTFVIG